MTFKSEEKPNALFTSVFPRLVTYFPALGIACSSMTCFAAFGTSYTLLVVTGVLIGLFQPITMDSLDDAVIVDWAKRKPVSNSSSLRA